MALIGSLAINMSVRTAQLVKGLKVGASAMQSFAKVGARVGGSIGGALIGRKNTEGVKSIAQAFRDANADAKVLSRTGLLDASNRLRIMRNLASDLGPALGGIGGRGLAGIMRLGKGLAGAGVKALAGGFRVLTGTIRMAAGAVGGLLKSLVSIPALLAGGAIGGLFVSAIKGAMDLFEQTNRAKIIFGEYAKSVIDMSDRMAVAFGVSRREFTAGAASFADIFRDAKYSEKDVASLSVHFNKLALDMSSFYDIPIADALEKIHSGLAGNVRPLRELGMSIYDATVKEYAYAHGIAKVGSELNEQQKIMVRAILIDEKSSKAHGDLANTARSAQNQVRSLAGRFENLKETIGTTLVGLLLPVFDDINTGLHAIQMAWDASRYAADQATRDAIAGTGQQSKGIGFVQRLIMYSADAWQSFKIAAMDALLAVNRVMLTLMDSMRTAVYTLAQLTGKAGIAEGFEEGVRKMQDARRALIKQQDKEKAAPLPSEGIADAFEKARADIGKTRAGLAAAPMLNPASLTPIGGPAKAAGEPKFASAAVLGSSEAANAMLRSRYGAGAGGKKPEEETAKNTRRLVQIIDRIAMGNREPVEIKGLPSWQLAAGGGLLAANI